MFVMTTAKQIVALSILPLFVFAIGLNTIGLGIEEIEGDYAHHHITISHPLVKICGDHICKPGEKYPLP